MKEEILHCDIEDLKHRGIIKSMDVRVIFDHDQEDGKSKTSPYFENHKIDMCESCRKYMFDNRRIVYAYGAMGYNKFYLKK